MGINFNQAASQIGLGPTIKPDVVPQTLDPKYTNLVKNINKTAVDYRKRLPDITGQQANIARDTARQQLARSYVDADRTANRRGMFYGGAHAGLRGEAENQVAGDLATKLRGINVAGESQANELENAAIEGAYGMRSDQQSLFDQAYNQAMSNRQKIAGENTGMSNQSGKIGGGLIGNLLGQSSSSDGGPLSKVFGGSKSGSGTAQQRTA